MLPSSRHAWNAKHDYDKVIADCGKSIELEPRNATGLITRAQAWLAKNEYDKAIADATAGIALDAAEPLAYLWRGLAWSRKKDFDKAIADYSDAIRLAPNDPQLYYNRAWAWQQKGNHARAMEDYAAGVELDPDHDRPRAEPASPPAAQAVQEEPADDFLSKLPLEHAATDVTARSPPQGNAQTGVVPAAFQPMPAPPEADQHVAGSKTPGQAAQAEVAPPLSRDSFGIVEPQTARDFAVRAGDWLRIKMYDKAIADCNEAVELGTRDPLPYIYLASPGARRKNTTRPSPIMTRRSGLSPPTRLPFMHAPRRGRRRKNTPGPTPISPRRRGSRPIIRSPTTAAPGHGPPARTPDSVMAARPSMRRSKPASSPTGTNPA